MTDEGHLTKGIMDIIQRVYGDATQTVLDERAAGEIWKWLREQGVATAQEVAVIVEAAGGEVRIPSSALLDNPPELLVLDDVLHDRIIRSRRREPDHG